MSACLSKTMNLTDLDTDASKMSKTREGGHVRGTAVKRADEFALFEGRSHSYTESKRRGRKCGEGDAGQRWHMGFYRANAPHQGRTERVHPPEHGHHTDEYLVTFHLHNVCRPFRPGISIRQVHTSYKLNRTRSSSVQSNTGNACASVLNTHLSSLIGSSAKNMR